ncbi:MAG: pyruvate, phosphate dikinase [Acidobacteriota bacterium]|nr:MAG: pyruvate, phosphate dikinase [Acidobacteriota bacterium]
MSNKWVYLFEEVEAAEKLCGSWEGVRAFLGGKGANLAEMTRIGVPVPPGYTVTTEACLAYLEDSSIIAEFMAQERAAMERTEELTGKKFGDPSNPLLVSCRSGAKFSMPGMMDTVLNLGLNDETAAGMIELTGDERFVYDSYRRLVQMFGSVVLDLDDELFEDAIDELKEERGIKDDTELTAEDWKELTSTFKGIIEKEGLHFPQDPYMQLQLATEAVFKSWNGKRAIDYRNAAGISHDLGTAVNICTMVFGNMGWNSGTGVTFTRNPSNGENKLYGDYLLNAQGEDVVAGIRNTKPIEELAQDLPEAYVEFETICKKLEKHYLEMQDVEFTIEKGKLWMLQTRDGKRTARASVKIAVDLANEGLIDRKTAVKRVKPAEVDTLMHPTFDPEAKKAAAAEGKLLSKGVNASPGAAVGVVAFDADLAEEWGKAGKAVIMVRPFTKPDDVHGMLAAKGILTSEGGATSHAAVVARQFGVPCVCGASDVKIDSKARVFTTTGGAKIKEGDWLSIDGTTGECFVGQIPTVSPKFEEQTDLLTLLSWADEMRKLQVWANADYPKDAERARSYGAQGIGLCRTEHMFFEEERLPIVQRMILSSDEETRQAALDQLMPMQRSDFDGIFRSMDGLPVIIRLIDPPLHEFLPDQEAVFEEVLSKKIKGQTEGLKEKEVLLEKIRGLHESNPMMGMRGVRLSIVMPGLVKMQVRAIFEAACDVAKDGIVVKPEVMIPLVGHVNELKVIQPTLEAIAAEVMEEKGIEVEYKFGTMIEIPRAALTADQVAGVAQFFSFGTNDLTQMTFGYSRDDAEARFLLEYVEQEILPENPFQSLDQSGVGQLMEIAVSKGRGTRPELEVGICGEHGGDPKSIAFCHKLGLNYVSCSPFRVPVARLAAAQAALK